MNKIDKFLAKLDVEQRTKVLAVMLRIQARDFGGLNIKKLGGFTSEYRVRISKFRIIFEMSDTSTRIIKVEFKNDNTYRK